MDFLEHIAVIMVQPHLIMGKYKVLKIISSFLQQADRKKQVI